MMDNIELLAPAGDWDAFLAAVENGADAVYLGGKLFNARQLAGNFDSGQLKKALNYAHVRGVNVYLAMNTLLSDDELEQAVDFAEEAYLMGIDGIIVQDLGFAKLLSELFPDLNIHGSTQMTTYNLEGVKVLEGLGFKRVVLARELSLEEIGEITRNTSLEIEVFVHGALCISYSGQCLMSSMIGGRSGNRGRCAQPCRLPYELLDGKSGRTASNSNAAGYLLSPKDLCSIEMLGEIIYSGVKSLKIEGRMKTPEYVATVVGNYRKYIDAVLGSLHNNNKSVTVDPEDMKDLAQIFNRGGFSQGYLKGKAGKDMMCYEKPKNWGIYLGEAVSCNRAEKTVRIRLEEELSIGDGIEIWNGEEQSPGNIVTEIKINGRNGTSAKRGDVVDAGSLVGKIFKGNSVYKTSDKKLVTGARVTFTGKPRKKAFLSCKMTVKSDAPVVLNVWDDRGNEVTLNSGIFPEAAVNRPLTEDKIREQLNKTGSTPFTFDAVEIELDEHLSLPVSAINDVRRRALEEMEVKRAEKYSRKLSVEIVETKKNIFYFPGNSRKRMDIKFSALIYKPDSGIDYSEVGVDRLYLPFSAFLKEENREVFAQYRKKGKEIFAWLPSITRGNYDKLIKLNLKTVVETGIDGILAGNHGFIPYLREFPQLKAAADYSFNLFNSFSLDRIHQLGLSSAALSPELTLGQVETLRDVPGLSREVIVYGRIPLMTTEYCPVGSIEGGCTGKSRCCEPCTRSFYKLKDRKGMEFPILTDRVDCRSIILNSNVLFIPDSLDKLSASGVDMMRLHFFDENQEEMREIAALYRNGIENGKENMEKYGNLIKKIQLQGYTKGHFHRGVQ